MKDHLGLEWWHATPLIQAYVEYHARPHWALAFGVQRSIVMWVLRRSGRREDIAGQYGSFHYIIHRCTKLCTTDLKRTTPPIATTRMDFADLTDFNQICTGGLSNSERHTRKNTSERIQSDS
jgi:hypothetical protein